MLFYTTPVPRAVFQLIPELKDAEIRVLLLIVHKTLGWKDRTGKNKTGKKETDWIACRQFLVGTGLSRRSVGIAIETLFAKGHIIVMDDCGRALDTPGKRKGKTRMYYRLTPALMPACEDYAQYVRKNIAALAQKARITSY